MNYTIGKNSILIIIDGTATSVPASHPNFTKLVDLLISGDATSQEVAVLLNIKAALKHYSDGEIDIDGDVVTRNGVELPKELGRRIVQCWRKDVPYKHLLKFFDRLDKNPSNRSREQLFSFLAHKGIPITDDGCFYAYKAVGPDWYSRTGGNNSKVLRGKTNPQGQIYNGVGEYIEVIRNYVKDDPEVGCSSGLHAGSEAYALSYCPGRGHMMVVKIDPAHVVSVPRDCGWQKLRTCAYSVVAEYKGTLSSDATHSPYDDYGDDESYDYDEGDIDELMNEDELRIRLS